MAEIPVEIVLDEDMVRRTITEVYDRKFAEEIKPLTDVIAAQADTITELRDKLREAEAEVERLSSHIAALHEWSTIEAERDEARGEVERLRAVLAVRDEWVQESKDYSTVLEPVESMALTVALAQVGRGEPVMENVAAACVLALARITGRQT